MQEIAPIYVTLQRNARQDVATSRDFLRAELLETITHGADLIARKVRDTVLLNPTAFAKQIDSPMGPFENEDDLRRGIEHWQVSVVVVSAEHMEGLRKEANDWRVSSNKNFDHVRELRQKLDAAEEELKRLKPKKGTT